MLLISTSNCTCHLKQHWQDLVSEKCQFSLKYLCIALLRIESNQRAEIPVSFISIRALYAHSPYTWGTVTLGCIQGYNKHKLSCSAEISMIHTLQNTAHSILQDVLITQYKAPDESLTKEDNQVLSQTKNFYGSSCNLYICAQEHTERDQQY